VLATRRRRLEQVHARLLPAPVTTRHGGAAPGLIVRFMDPGVPVRVLEHVWDELDDVRGELTQWLRGCARHELPTIRVRAAVAVGMIAARSFEVMRASVISPWAAAKDSHLRDAAAVALNSAAQEEPRLAPAIRSLVLAWASEDQQPALRAGAARAWRVLLDDDDSATDLLDSLADSDSADVAESICQSMAEYLTLDKESQQRHAIALLHSWTQSRDPQRRLVGEMAFLYAAADLVENRPGDAPGEEDVWPALLAIAARDPMQQEELASLWQAALCSSDVYEAAQTILAEWAYMAEPISRARRALGRLLAAASKTGRSARIIRYQAAQWTGTGKAKGAPETSRVVTRYLNGRDNKR
jgi:hypothetical protein